MRLGGAARARPPPPPTQHAGPRARPPHLPPPPARSPETKRRLPFHRGPCRGGTPASPRRSHPGRPSAPTPGPPLTRSPESPAAAAAARTPTAEARSGKWRPWGRGARATFPGGRGTERRPETLPDSRAAAPAPLPPARAARPAPGAHRAESAVASRPPQRAASDGRSLLQTEAEDPPPPASAPRPIGCPGVGGGASARRLAPGRVNDGAQNPASRRRLPSGWQAAGPGTTHPGRDARPSRSPSRGARPLPGPAASPRPRPLRHLRKGPQASGRRARRRRPCSGGTEDNGVCSAVAQSALLLSRSRTLSRGVGVGGRRSREICHGRSRVPRRGRCLGVCEPRGGGCGSGGGTAARREVGGRKWKRGGERARERERERAAVPRRAGEPTVVATRGGMARSVIGRGSKLPVVARSLPTPRVCAPLRRARETRCANGPVRTGERADAAAREGSAWRGLQVAVTDPSHFRLGPVKCRAQNTT